MVSEIKMDIPDIKVNPDDPTLFNMLVELVHSNNPKADKPALKGGTRLSREFFQNLSTDPKNKFRYITTVIQEESKFLRIRNRTENF